MILTKKVILDEIECKNIKITPLNKKNIGAASIDLTLSNNFRVFESKKVILTENVDYKKHSKLIKKNKMIIMPGQFVLGISKENINLPENICGWLYGRSRFARFGISIHSTASFVHPGVNNKQVFEISNHSNVPLVLKSGLKIAQLILDRTEGNAKYSGKFNNQKL
jgi:dCTP deaminase